MRRIVQTGILCGILLVIITGVAGAQEAAVPLTLEESVDIALKQSVIIQSAREGGRRVGGQEEGSLHRVSPEIEHDLQLHP